MPISISDFKNKVIGKISEKMEIKEIKSHHVRYQFWHKGTKILTTFCSHGGKGKDIRNDILSKIKRELKLNNLQQLYDLKD